MSAEFLSRIIGMAIFAYLGWVMSGVSGLVGSRSLPPQYEPWVRAIVLAAGAVGLLVTPYITVKPFRWATTQIKQLPPTVLFAASIGLFVGLIMSALLAVPLSMLPGYFGTFAPLAASLLLAYLGTTLMVIRERDMVQMVTSYMPSSVSQNRNGSPGTDKLIVDTSAIIDGRIADISKTGFLRGTLVIPRFILDELRHIADSSDSLRRNRGRRGLEMLNKLQKESDVPIEIWDATVGDAVDVDAKLVLLGRLLKAPIITNDFNLNRVAELQGVRALNINELANAVKSIVLPGEEIMVRVIQEGKETGQGVGFLDDGTMVVVEGGRRFINSSDTNIVVTRVLQTVAGRMIFAQPKDYP
ncbi:MAG: domain nuclease [Dehalococcoidia bacterium]|nr:domain nuclease [Dehalococcoidia bacterium]